MGMGVGWGGIISETVSHQRKQFTKKVATAVAGTQCLDRQWRSLKTFLGNKYPVWIIKDGHHCLDPALDKLIFQWLWRQHVLPQKPANFLKALATLLKST